MSQSKHTRPYAAPALQKGFEVIELLADYPDGALITEMAARLGRSVGELFRIVVVMEQAGYLRKSDATARYSVAFKFLDLAYRSTPAQSLGQAALLPMQWLAAETGQSCHLVVANGGEGLVIAREESPGMRGFALRVGAAVDMLSSCSGGVILAFSSTSQADRIIALAQSKRKEPVDRSGLTERLDAIRGQGHYLCKSSITLSVTDIGYPLFAFDGELAGVLTVPFLEMIDGSEKVDIPTARLKLSEASMTISANLGFTGNRR